MIVRPLNPLVLLLLLLASPSRPAVAATTPLVEPSSGPLTVLPPLPTDDCAIPTFIAGAGPFVFDTTLATTGIQGQAEAVCLFFATTAIEDDIWFAWTAPSTGFFAIETCAGTAMDSKIAVYDGGGCPAAGALACNDDFCGLQTRTVFAAVGGQFYTIQLGSFPGSGGGTGTFTITPTPVGVPPANDAACSATSINEFEDRLPVDSTNATAIPLQGAACAAIPGNGQLHTDVWYCWSNNTTDPYHFTLSRCETSPPADTMPSPGLILYSTDSCTPPCNPISPICGSVCSATEFCFTPSAIGQTYLLRIGSVTGSGGGGGLVHLTIESGCPDDCQTKGKITGTNFKTFDTGETTTGTEGQNNTGCYIPPGMDDDAWYDWLATQTGSVLVSTCGFTTVDTRIVVYAGTACPPGAVIACNDDVCGAQSQVCFLATAGTHYTIQVGKSPATPDGSVTFLVAELPSSTSCSSLSGLAYCAGDGIDPNVTNSCPCANFGSVGNGCASSFNAGGASLTASGTAALDDVVLQAAGVNATGNTIFLRGSMSTNSGIVFGDGIRCVSGPLLRRTKPIFSAGQSTFPAPTDTVTLSDGWGSGSGTPPGSGITAYYAVYYRNAAAVFCPPQTFNATNGYEITW